MSVVSNTITLEVAPHGQRHQIRLWVGQESVRVFYGEKDLENAIKRARTIQRELKGCLSAEIVIVTHEPNPPTAGPQPLLFKPNKQ